MRAPWPLATGPLATGLIAAAALLSAPAWAARSKITPYLQVQQIGTTDFQGKTDSVTYTQATIGVDAKVRTARVEVTGAYRYERRFSEGKALGNADSHDGLARVRIELVSDLLSLETGAVATKTRTDPGGAAPVSDLGNATNLSQTFGFYIGPALRKNLGGFDVEAGYRFGYVAAEGSQRLQATGQPSLDRYNNGTSHKLDVSIGMKAGTLPFGWTVKAQYEREGTGQLDQLYETGHIIGEARWPLSHSVALVSSAGYEKIQTSQRSAKLDGNGQPITDTKGRFVTDPASPRMLSYDVAGVIAEGGIIWQPSRRTRAELRAGYRYESFSVNGLFEYRINRSNGVTLLLYDKVDSFGRSLTESIANVPVEFDQPGGSSSSAYQQCIFGSEPGTGSCVGSTLGTSTTANYRNRGLTAIYSYRHGRNSLAMAVGYARRRYIDQTGVGSLAGVVDQNWFAQMNFARQLGQRAGLDFAVTGSILDNGLAGVPDVRSVGATGTYHQTIGAGLQAEAIVGVESSERDGADSSQTGQIRLGVRYQF